MSYVFDPKNNIVRHCILGMVAEDSGKLEEAGELFLKAFNESTNDFERFIAAYHMGRFEQNNIQRLKWMETSLECALAVDDVCTKSALPLLYLKISKCYEALGESEKSKSYDELANSFNSVPADEGPFYHGTKADLQVGDLLVAGHNSNYENELKMNHIYFTSNLNGAGLAAGLAKGEGSERVYVVEPMGLFEHDPNVTDKKFPGNLTRAYRSQEPLKIIGETENWMKQTPEDLSQWRKKIAENNGKIIN